VRFRPVDAQEPARPTPDRTPKPHKQHQRLPYQDLDLVAATLFVTVRPDGRLELQPTDGGETVTWWSMRP